jgi:tetratricopeptide (TPR) repeat protein
MQSIFYSKKFRYLNRNYLFQTTYNESDHTAVCSLFSDGRLLNIDFSPLPEHSEGNELVENILKIHEDKLEDYQILLKVTESKKDSDRIEVVIKLGKTLLANKLYDEALELLQSASRKHEGNSTIKLLLGKIHAAKNRFEEAKSEFSRAVDLSPEYPDFRNLLGETYLHLKKPIAAIEQFKKAVDFNVYYDRAFYNLGLGYILNGIVKEDFELAKNIRENCDQAFGKAIAINPVYNNDNYRTGMDLLNEGKMEEAYEKLLVNSSSNGSDSPYDKLLEMYIRCVYGDEGTTEENVQIYIEKIESLLRGNPGYADLENELGMAYTIMGKIMRDKAITHFRRAAEINPNFGKALKNIKLAENDLRGFDALLEAILK